MPIFGDSAAPFNAAVPGAIGGTTPSAGTFTTLTANVGSPNATSTQIRSGDGSIDVGTTIQMYDDFQRNSFGTGGTILWVAAGGNAAVMTDDTDANHKGVVKFATTGAVFRTGGYCGMQKMRFEGVSFEAIMKSDVISSAAQEYKLLCGFSANADDTIGADAIVVVYDRANYGTNWQLICVAASTSSVSDTGIAYAANTWQRLGFTCNAAGTSVQGYVNGVAGGTPITTNIPTPSATFQYAHFYLFKSNGTNVVNGYIDAFRLRHTVSR